MNDETAQATVEAIEIREVLKMIPHRYPLLLVDRVEDIVPGESAVGLKNVTANEPQFQGHFPDHPIMPGVMIIESMAQTSAVLVVKALGDEGLNKLVYFMSIDSAKFRKPVVPGDQMRIYLQKDRQRGNVWRFSAEAKVDGGLVAEATFTAMIIDPEDA